MNFIKACLVSELPGNSQKIVQCGVHKVALFNFNDEISAIANSYMNYSGLAPVVIKALQEQQALLDQLEKRMAGLEKK